MIDKIIDFIKKIFHMKSTEDEFIEFIGKIDYSDIIRKEIDTEVKYTIDMKQLGLNEERMFYSISRKVYDEIDRAITKLKDFDHKKANKYKQILNMDLVKNYIYENLLLEENDYIIEAYQRFIDNNLEKVRLEDERLAKLVEDQYEDLDKISEEDIKKASNYDINNMDVYNDVENRIGYDEEIIPPVDEESDVIIDDGSIEILDNEEEFSEYGSEDEL